jgi:hypothetical protein
MITPTVYNLLGERNSYPVAPNMTVIPAKRESTTESAPLFSSEANYQITFCTCPR